MLSSAGSASATRRKSCCSAEGSSSPAATAFIISATARSTKAASNPAVPPLVPEVRVEPVLPRTCRTRPAASARSRLDLSLRVHAIARENLLSVLMSATSSSWLVADAIKSGGRSNHLSAVPTPSSCSLPCNRHFWQDTQSRIDEMLWKTPLNWRLSDHHVCTWGCCEGWKSWRSSKAEKTDEHDCRMHDSSSRSTSARVRSASSVPRRE
mmetsp:Transcript_25775/g.66670  ORF Transcript_25775/g.66670 Transcript_25775/m.66670 type:complete len:210 (-) Transcript_25775:92-721(-)